MRWNPYLSACAAAAYIVVIASGMKFISATQHNKPNTLFDPIGALSVFVFSAAMMAFLFFYRPVLLLIENKKTEAVSYFLKTLAAFGVMTAVAVALVLY